VLASCVAAGVPVGLASSASRPEIELVLAATNIGAFFATIRSGDDVSRPKPHPEIYLSALADLGVEPSLALAIEDSPFGVSAAVAAGMYCVGVRTAAAPQLSLAAASVITSSLEGETVASLWRSATVGRDDAASLHPVTSKEG
jgi:beta-phosphoglucomutase-like phosphatase (HAD superfamily)